MVENRPFLTFLAHLVLIVGVVIVAFPVYVAIIASTRASNEFLSGLIPLLPGPHAIENYSRMLSSGVSTSRRSRTTMQTRRARWSRSTGSTLWMRAA